LHLRGVDFIDFITCLLWGNNDLLWITFEYRANRWLTAKGAKDAKVANKGLCILDLRASFSFSMFAGNSRGGTAEGAENAEKTLPLITLT